MKTYFTEQTGFFGKSKPSWLLREFGSPLYLYNEAILRERCREMAGLISCSRFKPNYSTKANSNPELLKIIREEGFDADAVNCPIMCLFILSTLSFLVARIARKVM